MLRKVIRSVSRGRERERSPSPEFVCCDARVKETSYRTQSGDRVTQMKDTFDPYGRSPSSPSSQEVPIYLDTGLEALSLETLIKPTLNRMRVTLSEREKLLPPMPDLPAHSRRGSLTVPAPAHVLPHPPISRDLVVLKRATPDIVVTPPAEKSSSSGSSSNEHNPFELEFGSIAPLEVTPLPARPPLRRKAVSYRTQRELPLRVQAVRRSHQEQYARQILERSQLNREGMVRRASETAVPLRPKPTPVQTADNNRSQSVSHQMSALHQQPRSRSASRTGSRQRHERLPSGPHRMRSQETEDFYLMAALSSWDFKP
ncbi:MAG: hypothetical protein EOO38_00165 [Cytophagaceae bacterium]|nr:MAG: hypothetical protein EOO38_00165 [Cytophagaceae bacterium]